MVQYIGLMWEEFKFPYVPHPYYNPENFYNIYTDERTMIIQGNIMDEGLRLAADIGDIELVKYFLANGAKALANPLALAALNGRRDIIDLLIAAGADDWNYAMDEAAKGGHTELVKFFISKMKPEEVLWNSGLASAAAGGHKDLVDFFIANGANDWGWAFRNAVGAGNRDLIEFFLKKGPIREKYWDVAFDRADKHPGLYEYLQEKAKEYPPKRQY